MGGGRGRGRWRLAARPRFGNGPDEKPYRYGHRSSCPKAVNNLGPSHVLLSVIVVGVGGPVCRAQVPPGRDRQLDHARRVVGIAGGPAKCRHVVSASSGNRAIGRKTPGRFRATLMLAVALPPFASGRQPIKRGSLMAEVSVNRAWRLRRRPVGAVVSGDLGVVSEPAAALRAGQALVRTLGLSVEAASRIWMGHQRAFMPPVSLSEVMRGVGVGEGVESRREDMKGGRIVAGVG